MQKWEYKIVTFQWSKFSWLLFEIDDKPVAGELKNAPRRTALHQFGVDGWELVSYSNSSASTFGTYIFKRSIE